MQDKLLREEKIIVNALRKYEALRWEQLIKLVYNKSEEVATKILNGLKKKQIILEDEGGYVTLDNRSTADDKTVRAFWVLLQFINKMDPYAHYKASHPASIFFLKDDTQYEVIVLNPNEEFLLKMIFDAERENSSHEEDATKYIIVVPNTDAIDDCVNNIPEEYFDKRLILFATCDYKNPSDDIPTVELFQPNA